MDDIPLRYHVKHVLSVYLQTKKGNNIVKNFITSRDECKNSPSVRIKPDYNVLRQ